MSKRTRQYLGLFVAIISYYLIHEGAHLAYALITGVFKQVNVIVLGVQIDVWAEKMADNQMGIFCLMGFLFVANAVIFIKVVLPKYKMAFK